MLEGFRFEKRTVSTGVDVAYRIGGEGQPLLLLHGKRYLGIQKTEVMRISSSHLLLSVTWGFL